jgi:hypothetical protein
LARNPVWIDQGQASLLEEWASRTAVIRHKLPDLTRKKF